jgi:hypothetical protein
VYLVMPACLICWQVSYKLAWTAISSLLAQFRRQYGPAVLLHLNIAYFFPSIPVLAVQVGLGNSPSRVGMPFKSSC